MPNFKFDSQTFFLTYPQAGTLEYQAIVDHIVSLADLDWARICKEKHEDGSPHFHIVGRFKKRFQSRNPRVFDVAGKHPNVQSVRSIAKSIKYVSKDGEFWDIGTVPDTANTGFDILAAAKELSEADYYRACLEARVSYQYAKHFWDMQRKSSQTEVAEDYVPDLSRECMHLLCSTYSPNKATVVVGPTGCGKTSWAKRVCPKPALWVRHLDVLRAFRPGYHKAIIFDDMSFKHMPREAQIHIADWHDEAHIHCRYGHATIPAETVKIFTCNEYCFSEDAAIDRRVYRLDVDNSNP